MSFVEPDWAQLWRELVSESTRYRQAFGHGGEQRYLRRLDAAGQAAPADDLIGFVASRLSRDSTVIDIGAAAGRWTIPLAQVAAKVTALEPEPELLAALRRNAAAAGLTNIEAVAARWEQWDGGAHDVVLCSHSMYGTAELMQLVSSMQHKARRCCFMVMRALSREGAMAELSRRLRGHHHDSPSFEVGYNVLLSMGIQANVLAAPTVKHWLDESLEAALGRAKRHLHLDPADGTHDSLIREVLQAHLRPAGDGLRWDGGTRSVLMWWLTGGR